ncbi:MAG: hypothetical protein QXY90_07030 [Candidatus Anstonellales archaeon]
MSDRVIFLGAGASHASDFRLPLMKGFFNEENLHNYPHLEKMVQKLYPNSSLEEINLESLITHLDLTLDGFGASWKSPDYSVHEARNEFKNYVVNCLSNPIGRNVLH